MSDEGERRDRGWSGARASQGRRWLQCMYTSQRGRVCHTLTIVVSILTIDSYGETGELSCSDEFIDGFL